MRRPGSCGRWGIQRAAAGAAGRRSCGRLRRLLPPAACRCASAPCDDGRGHTPQLHTPQLHQASALIPQRDGSEAALVHQPPLATQSCSDEAQRAQRGAHRDGVEVALVHQLVADGGQVADFPLQVLLAWKGGSGVCSRTRCSDEVVARWRISAAGPACLRVRQRAEAERSGCPRAPPAPAASAAALPANECSTRAPHWQHTSALPSLPLAAGAARWCTFRAGPCLRGAGVGRSRAAGGRLRAAPGRAVKHQEQAGTEAWASGLPTLASTSKTSSRCAKTSSRHTHRALPGRPQGCTRGPCWHG